MFMPVLDRNVVCVCAGALALSACAGSSLPRPVTANSAATGVRPQTHEQRFDYTGEEQKFVVPSGVTKVRVIAYGAIGGGVTYPSNYSEIPGLGGRVSAKIAVSPGETLAVFVGGAPTASAPRQGGFNGGGAGGWGGGGATDIRQSGDYLSDRILVAGGGGGAGGTGIYLYSGTGGAGGGTTGGSGSSGGNGALVGQGGTGGSQTGGGNGGAGGRNTKQTRGMRGDSGMLGTGGYGGLGGPSPGRNGFSGGTGGGGGGGFYGGGGGGGGAGHGFGEPPGAGGGGGGGSSYVEPSAKRPVITRGVWKHNGVVTFSW